MLRLSANSSPKSGATDAQQVEEAFATKLAVITPQSAKPDDVTTSLTDQTVVENRLQIKKSVAGFPEPRRKRWSRLSEQIFRVDKWSLCRG